MWTSALRAAREAAALGAVGRCPAKGPGGPPIRARVKL